jgi:hypothetical protein
VTPDCFTITHLVRDCAAFEEERVAFWTLAQQAAVAAEIHIAQPVLQQRHEWFLLTCGAAVPHTFMKLHLDMQTHFARAASATTAHDRKRARDIPVYRKLLHLTGLLLQFVVARTGTRLEAVKAALPRTPRSGVRHPQVKHRLLELELVEAHLALA